MEIKVIKNEKEYIEVEIDNLTVAELLRNLLWKDKATEFAAWKRDHPTKNPRIVLRTKGRDAKKVLLDTIGSAREMNSQMLKEFKRAVR